MAYAYLLIERQCGTSLAVRYATTEAAEEAMTDSLFIDALCEEDCLDAWVDDEVPPGFELVIPPPEGLSIQGLVNPRGEPPGSLRGFLFGRPRVLRRTPSGRDRH